MLIATHDGSFHADETLACAVISYIHERSEVIRSRDPQRLETADIIIDVSGINDDRHFDHHSNEFNLSRPNGINYATAGLMWLKFGDEYMRKIAQDFMTYEQRQQLTDEIFLAARERIDREVMYAVDLNDNGQLNTWLADNVAVNNEGEQRVMDELNEFYRYSPDIAYLVAMQNLPNVSGAEQDKNFMNTVKMLKNLLINAAVNALYTELGIARVMSVYDGGEILIMHEKLPWTQAVLANFDAFKNCMLAVYPDRKRGWRVQSLPFSKAERFKNKLTAPKSWRGLDFEALDAATGLSGTIFVHRAGFTGGAMDFDTNLEMARIWLREGERCK
ncbi:MYG1 family protein [Anaerobiospirillum sp. NML120449]|uniref:MYG1 family protein n=1 Tax=Anaerobiospirillum sp. NML120449 TaxID=2932817 RepID=UPI001FF1BEFF|nr:MYG1 family protein [Anaerobiospirillum sp. NML120449]